MLKIDGDIILLDNITRYLTTNVMDFIRLLFSHFHIS
jgi:hypothetical protein